MFTEITDNATNEFPAVIPTVKIDGKLTDDMRVLMIEDTAGTVPGKARLRYLPGMDMASPQTLKAAGDKYQYGSRVIIAVGDEILFQGILMLRQDQGSYDSVIWTALDDRHILSQIPVRGALVYDPAATGDTIFLPRYSARTNPNGFWNCTGVNINGDLWPIFSHTAHLGKTYESPTDAYRDLDVGKLTAWTPRRFLMYLCLLATVSSNGQVDGINAEHWRSLYDTDYLDWKIDDIKHLKGLDPAYGSTDPLDRKMPDMTFQGQKLLLAISKTLDAAGTHGLRLRYDADGKSWIDLFPRGFSGMETSQAKNDARTIRVKRGGLADDVNTAFDFKLHEDATKCYESVLVEGDVVRVESRMDTASGILVKAWTAAEETAFQRVINGGDGSGDYAKIPITQGEAYDASTWVDADGTNGKPYAERLTTEAINLARQLYPNVYKAFYLDTDQMSTILDGQDGEFTNQWIYPRLSGKGTRGISPQQLQYILRDMGSGEDIANMLRDQYPVRIEVQNSYGWTDVLYTTGLRMTGDGRIWIDGLAENVNGQNQCIYSGDLEAAPLSVTLRSVRINAATVMDHRVYGYRDIGDAKNSVFADAYQRAMHGLPMAYIDSPQSYREHHQVNSYPTANTSFYGGAAGSTLASAPLTRMCPPGSERNHAEYAASRKLTYSRHPHRNSSWSLIGIRPEYRAGMWIDKIKVIDSDNAVDGDYGIDAPLMSVAYDFQSQITVCGGLISELTGA